MTSELILSDKQATIPVTMEVEVEVINRKLEIVNENAAVSELNGSSDTEKKSARIPETADEVAYCITVEREAMDTEITCCSTATPAAALDSIINHQALAQNINETLYGVTIYFTKESLDRILEIANENSVISELNGASDPERKSARIPANATEVTGWITVDREGMASKITCCSTETPAAALDSIINHQPLGENDNDTCDETIYFTKDSINRKLEIVNENARMSELNGSSDPESKSARIPAMANKVTDCITVERETKTN